MYIRQTLPYTVPVRWDHRRMIAMLNVSKVRPRPVLRLLLRAKLLSLVEYSVIIIGQIKTDGLLVPVPFSGLLFICAYRIRLLIESYQN